MKKNQQISRSHKNPTFIAVMEFWLSKLFYILLFIFLLKTFIVIKVYTVLSTTEIVLDIKIGIWLWASVTLWHFFQNGYLFKKYSSRTTVVVVVLRTWKYMTTSDTFTKTEYTVPSFNWTMADHRRRTESFRCVCHYKDFAEPLQYKYSETPIQTIYCKYTSDFFYSYCF